MDSTNNTTTNLNPLPRPMPMPGAPRPGGPGAPVPPPMAPPVPPVPPVNPLAASGDTASATSAQPVAGNLSASVQSAAGAAPIASTQPAVGMAPASPVSPIQPIANTAASVDTMPKSDIATPVATVTPASPIARPTNIDGINTAPRRTATMPTGLTDEMINSPVGAGETVVTEEINESITTTNPFTMSDDKPTPSVSFADPADQPGVGIGAQDIAPTKKKSSRTALIVLSVIAFVVAIALAVVLVMVTMGIGPFASL